MPGSLKLDAIASKADWHNRPWRVTDKGKSQGEQHLVLKLARISSMYRPHDRNDLERRMIEAHDLYIDALALFERLQDEVEAGSPGVGTDVIQAECLLAERRFVLIALLNELGHMPTGLKAKLPPREGGRRTEATADPDLAAMRRSYLAWRGEPASLEARPASRPMMNLGRILTLLGILSVEDESAENADEAAIAS